MIGNLARRWHSIRSFAAAGRGWLDQASLALAGFVRHRPFGDNSLYGRIGRLLCHRIAPRISLAGGQRIEIDLSSLVDPMIFEEIYVDHIYPIDRVPFQPDLIIDCGSCSGMFALLAHARFPSSRIIAFEPEPRNYSRLRHNIEENRARIESFPMAVGLREGRARFTGEGFGGHLASAEETNAITVDIVSLPDVLRQLQPERLLLKMDIEGAERDVLPGILDLLPPQTVIFLETHQEEAVCAGYLQPYKEAGFQHELVRRREDAGPVSIYVERLLIRRNAPVRHFCTYFDRNYSSLGLALYDSLQRHSPAFCLWVLCLDDETHALLSRLALPHMRLIRLEDFERDDPALRQAKAGRSMIEYYFTCTPSLPLYILQQVPALDLITYLDADVFFYSDPDQVFSEIGVASVAIVKHRFPPILGHMEESGIYNVGWITFRRDDDGLACLRWWRERCLEWCFIRHEPGRYADQKYLDEWPRRFRNVKVIGQKGANLAMWNLANYQVVRRGRNVFVDDDPLVFFHFHGLRRPQPWIFSMSTPYYQLHPTRQVTRWVFVPFVRTLAEIEEIHGIGAEPGCRLVPDDMAQPPRTLLQHARFAAHLVFNVLRRNYILVRHGRIIAAP